VPVVDGFGLSSFRGVFRAATTTMNPSIHRARSRQSASGTTGGVSLAARLRPLRGIPGSSRHEPLFCYGGYEGGPRPAASVRVALSPAGRLSWLRLNGTQRQPTHRRHPLRTCHQVISGIEQERFRRAPQEAHGVAAGKKRGLAVRAGRASRAGESFGDLSLGHAACGHPRATRRTRDTPFRTVRGSP